MKLYQSNLSPFSARVRAQIYAKGLDVQIEPPPGGTSSPEFMKINPTGKVPCLKDGAFVLPESEVICEYLEDKFQTPSLRSADPQTRARQRLINRLIDLYIYGAVSKLFGQMNPTQRDQAIVNSALAELDKGLASLEHNTDGPNFAVGGALSLADCALATGLFFPSKLLGAFGRTNPFAATPKLGAYYKAISQNPPIAKVLGEMDAALIERMKSAA